MTEPHRPAPRAPIPPRRDVPPRRGLRGVLLCGLVALAAGTGVAGLVAGGNGASTATAAAVPSGDALIRAAQRELGVPADGVLGPATRTALRAFQRASGLPPTGQLDEGTLVALGLAEQRLSVLTTTVASGAASEAMAEQASAPVTEQPAQTTVTEPAATTTTPTSTATTPAATTTAPEPVEEDEEGPAAPVAGGALAGAPPPVVGGQLPEDAGLSPVPPRRDGQGPARGGPDIPPPGGLSPRPPVSETAPISPELRARLDRIARCESGGDPRAVSRDGRYRGKYQFSRATWRAVGGKGDPAAASEGEQDRRAAMLYRRTGPSSWPVCGRA